MKRLKRSLLIPLLLALLPAIVIIMLLPPVFEKYEITETARHIKEKEKCWVTYHDIDADGKNELIKTIDTEIGKAAIMVFKPNGKLISQYNYPGSFVERNRQVTFGDFNNDSIAEIYYSTKWFLNIADKIIELNKNLNDYDIKYKIEDLFDENNKPKGKRIIITIPQKT